MKLKCVSLALVVWASTISLASQASAAGPACEPQLVKPVPAKKNDYSLYTVRLKKFDLQFAGEADAPNTDGTWTEGFVSKKIGSSTKPCQASDGINTEIYSALNDTRVVAFSYSGSTSLVEVINPDGCKKLSSVAAYTPKMTISGSELTVVPACECGDEHETKCQCDPGGIYTFGKGCLLKRDDKKSLAQTQAVLGVSFAKESWVAFPSTPKAKILGEWKAK